MLHINLTKTENIADDDIWRIIRLNDPVSVLPVTDMSQSETESNYLAYLSSINRNQFGHAEITIDFPHIFAIIQLL